MADDTNTDVIVERLDQVKGALIDLACRFDKIDGWRQSFELSYVKERADLERKVDKAHTRVDTLDKKISKLEGMVYAIVGSACLMVFGWVINKILDLL